jgi:uncharacterized protein YwqG
MESLQPFPAILAKFDRDLESCGLQAIRDQLLPLTYPCYRIHATLPSEDDIPKSHLAGLPDLPEGFSWPMEDDEHQTFLAQIHLDDLPEPRIGALPEKGTLWVFLGADEPAYDIQHHVIFSDAPKSELQPMPPPGETVFEDERQFSRLNLDFELACSLDETYKIEALDPYYSDIDALRFKIGQYTDLSQILGHGLAVSGNPREEAYLVRCGKPRLIHHTHLTAADVQSRIEEALADQNTRLVDYNRALLEDIGWYHEHKENHPEEIRKWRLLIQINSYMDAGMCWWDAGYLQFWIHEDDLAQRNFSNTYCGLETS